MISIYSLSNHINRFKYCAVGNDETRRQCNNCYNDSMKPRRPRFAYCPYEIYSGDRARMARCLRRLMDTPDKFMMIFQDGKLVHDEVGRNGITSFQPKDLTATSIPFAASLAAYQ